MSSRTPPQQRTQRRPYRLRCAQWTAQLSLTGRAVRTNRRYISGRDAIAQHIIPSTEYPNVDFVGTGNGAYCDQHQAQVLPSQNLCPPGSARFVSGDNTGFVSVTHSGEASNGTSQLTVNFHDSLGNLLYAFTKGNPRHMRATTTPPKTLTSWSTLADENAGTTATGVTKPLQSALLPASPIGRAAASGSGCA